LHGGPPAALLIRFVPDSCQAVRPRGLVASSTTNTGLVASSTTNTGLVASSTTNTGLVASSTTKSGTKKSRRPASNPPLASFTTHGMHVHPITTPASPSLASPLFDASFDSFADLELTDRRVFLTCVPPVHDVELHFCSPV
jgi:hypothetical protein